MRGISNVENLSDSRNCWRDNDYNRHILLYGNNSIFTGRIELLDILELFAEIFKLSGFILVGLMFFHLGQIRTTSILKSLLFIFLGFGILNFILNTSTTKILIVGELPIELAIPLSDLGYFTFSIVFIIWGTLFGTFLIQNIAESRVFYIFILIFAFGCSAFHALLIIFYFSNPFNVYLQYVIVQTFAALFTLAFLVFTIIWIVKQSSISELKPDTPKQEKPIEQNLSLQEKIIKASKVYTRISYKKLANILNCKPRALLDQLMELVNEKKVNAKIEDPDVIFQEKLD